MQGYRSDKEWDVLSNIRHAEKYAIKYWKKGYAVICPHKNTALFGGVCGDNVWLEGDKEFLKRSDIIVMIPGWENSEGATEELWVAEEYGKEIIYET